MSRALRFATADDVPQGLRKKLPPAPLAKAKRRPRRDEEHAEQVVFFNRIRTLALNKPRYALAARSTHAIPNGGGRSRAEAGRLKAEGVTRGVPDIFCRLAVPGHHGLYIEMKKCQGGRVSDEQETWIEESRMLGYAAHVCRGADEAFACWYAYVESAFTPGTIDWRAPWNL
jgi:hypothetical protein